MARLLPYLDRNLTDLPGETWQNAYGFEGLYEVSNLGRVKSLSRLNSIGRRIRERIRAQFSSHKNSGMWVRLFADATRQDVPVGPLVLNSFGVFATEPAHVAMHLNKTGSDNRLTNLCFVSQLDSVRRNWQMGISAWSETAWDWRETEQAAYAARYVSEDTAGVIWIVCIRCGAEKPESDYAIPGRNRSRICHECRALTNGIKQVGLSRYKQILREQGLKECTGCQQVKPLSDFYKRLNFQTARCKVCTDESDRTRRKGSG